MDDEDEIADTSLARATRRLFWDTAKETPVRLTIALVGPALTVFIEAFVGPYVISLLLDQIQQGTASLSTSWPLVVAYFLTQVVGLILGWRIALYAAWTFQVIGQKKLFERIFDKLTSMSMGFHADRFGGSLVSATNKLTSAFELAWDTMSWTVIPVIASVVSAVVILSFIMWQYALFLGVMSVIFGLIAFATTKPLERKNVAEARAANTMTGYLSDVLTNIAAVKAQGSERAEAAQASAHAEVWRTKTLSVMRSFLWFSSGYASVLTILNTGAVLAAVLIGQGGTVSVASVYLAVTYTLTVTEQLWEMNVVMRNYNQVLGDAHDMVEILQLEPDVVDLTSTPFQPGPGRIEIDSITFGHGDRFADPLFRDFSLTIKAGERVGLVGHSGSGKTTLTKLLLRFADVSEGTIRIDGQCIRDVVQSSLRTQIAYVSQEPMLFHRSLAANIAYGRPDATMEQVREAARQASALEFIEALPEGFTTEVGERGVKLSGGQRQRIAIARAVLKDAPILILDEATSALDSESEAHIQQALNAAMVGRTTVAIAHRLSTIKAMDRIVVLSEGKIVEQGSHEELIALGGTYATLWAHQSGTFMHEDV